MKREEEVENAALSLPCYRTAEVGERVKKSLYSGL